VNNVLAETGRIPLDIGLPSKWGFVICGRMFSEGFAGELLHGGSEKYEGMDHWLRKRNMSLHWDTVGDHGGGNIQGF
jgi:hypothetical protein